MPELPEVETVRRGLEPAMSGVQIAHADVRRPDLRWPFPDNMSERLTGATITVLRRRSKYILLDLDTKETLIIHLGMSGRMTIDEAPTARLYSQIATPAKHDHVIFEMANGTTVRFNDARRFGAMDLATTEELDAHWLLRDIGPEPFGNDFHEDYLTAHLKTRRSPIKTVLLDQRFVAGLGNIYVCEVLHRTGISPKKMANTLSAKRARRLVPAIRDVLSEAIEAGGSSLQDHRQASGELGYFQHNFAVYAREGEGCKTQTCKGSIRRLVQSGRSSFYCPLCQR